MQKADNSCLYSIKILIAITFRQCGLLYPSFHLPRNDILPISLTAYLFSMRPQLFTHLSVRLHIHLRMHLSIYCSVYLTTNYVCLPILLLMYTYHQSICLHGQPQTCLLIHGFSLFFFKRANLSDTLYFGGGGCEWVALSGPHSGSEPQNVVRRTKYFRNYSGPRTS